MSRPLRTRPLPAYLLKPGCRKRAFDTKDAADNHIHKIHDVATRRKTKRSQVLPSRAYACPDCGRWHLTSKPAKAAGDYTGGYDIPAQQRGGSDE